MMSKLFWVVVCDDAGDIAVEEGFATVEEAHAARIRHQLAKPKAEIHCFFDPSYSPVRKAPEAA